MKRALLPSLAFVRASRRHVQKNPSAANALRAALEKLSADAFDPKLRTHKLKGALDGNWAASAGYDLRIIFQFVKHEGVDVILLQSVGTHDDVY